MKKFNSKMTWLSNKPDKVGDLYGTITAVDVGDNKQAIIYYSNGIKEIDNAFDNYIADGYVSEIFFHENAIVFYLNKYRLKRLYDESIFILNRNEIIDIKEYDVDNVEIAELEQIKHITKAVGRRAFGLIGSLVGLATEQIEVKKNTIFIPGKMFKIQYYDLNKNVQILKYYCAKNIYSAVGVFFMNLIQKNLREDLKKPMIP